MSSSAGSKSSSSRALFVGVVVLLLWRAALSLPNATARCARLDDIFSDWSLSRSYKHFSLARERERQREQEYGLRGATVQSILQFVYMAAPSTPSDSIQIWDSDDDEVSLFLLLHRPGRLRIQYKRWSPAGDPFWREGRRARWFIRMRRWHEWGEGLIFQADDGNRLEIGVQPKTSRWTDAALATLPAPVPVYDVWWWCLSLDHIDQLRQYRYTVLGI